MNVMNKISLLKSVFLIGGSSLLASGCVYHDGVRYQNPPPPVVAAPAVGGELYVDGPPPGTTVVEGQPTVIAPDPAFVWVPGAWIWEGRWVWGPGHWMRPPRVGAVWVGPRYVFRGGRHVWVRGFWR